MSKTPDIHPIDLHIGQKLRAKRLEAKLSQEELGKSVDLTFQQIQKYEKSTNRISASTLFNLAKQLGVNVSYFFEGLTPQEYSFDNISNLVHLADYEEKYEHSIPSTELDNLIKAYLSVKDQSIRQNILQLVQSIANEHNTTSLTNKKSEKL